MGGRVVQNSLKGRQRAEDAIRDSLTQLDPGGELEGTILQRYYPWPRPGDIPGEMLERVAKNLHKDVQALGAMGEDKYFANLTPAEKLDLHKRALTLVDIVINGGGYDPHHPMTFADFEEIRKACILAASPWPDGTENVLFDVPERPPAEDEPDAAMCIIAYINGKTDRNYGREFIALRQAITGRLEGGYTLDDLKLAVDAREAAGWDGTAPDDVFGAQFDAWLWYGQGKNAADRQTTEGEYEKWMSCHRKFTQL